LFENREEYEKAADVYSKLLAVQQRMFDLNPEEIVYMKDLAVTYTSLEFFHFKRGDIEQGAHYHRLALEIYEKLLEECSDDPEALQRFIIGFYLMGPSLKFGAESREKEDGIGKDYLELAKKAEKKLLAIKPEILGEQELMAEIAEKMGISFREKEMYEDAIEEFERALAIRKKLHEKNPEELNYLTVLESTFYQMGITFLAQANLEKAKEALEKAMNFNAKLLETDSEDFDYLTRSSMILEKYSSVLEKMGKAEEAAQYLTQAEEISTKLEEDYE
jgi:tetratricopeptide (TPR) repeat protein